MELDALMKNCKQYSTSHLQVIIIIFIFKLYFYYLIWDEFCLSFFFNLKFIALCQLTAHDVVFSCQKLEKH